MSKLMGIFLIVLILAGCSDQYTPNDQNNNPDALPQQSLESSQTAPADPSPVPSLPATAAPVSAYLETGKLQSTFGFADGEGKHILITRDDQGERNEMALLNTAIGDSGNVLSVKFEKWQGGNENNNGRELSSNFANLPGFLFTLEEGSAVPDETYYLTDRAEFNLQSLLLIEPAAVNQEPSAIEESVRSDIKAGKKREIKQIWKLAELSADRQLYLVQFVRQGKDMLFSLVLKKGNGFTFKDYPAVIQDDENSVWRVDDGGVVTPEMFSILFAAETSKGLLLGLNWRGAEGVNTFFLKQEGDSFEEMDIQYSRYTSPQ
ncbi:hypothetical protein PaeBR_16770 [Paenibacillus sp. BR2-3]|uniref:hypothetical protein n=1 Tax=Paenibacillus sp. BR2-3 TaxID=3048494 RepID=UPI003977B7ED